MDVMIITILAFYHWIGDFVLQTDDMAKGKSKSNWILAKHVSTYSIIMSVALFFIVLLFETNVSFLIGFIWILSNFVLHFVTDFFTSRLSSELWEEGKVHDFFVCIGLDQLLHLIALLLTTKLLIIG